MKVVHNNVAIKIENSEQFYNLQKIFLKVGLCWRGRENSPKYEESYENIKKLANGTPFYLYFANSQTVDFSGSSAILSQSGRQVVSLTMSLANFPSSNLDTLLKRLEVEIEKAEQPEKPTKKVAKKKKEPKMIIGVDFADAHSDFNATVVSIDGKIIKEIKSSKLSKKKREPIQINSDEITMIQGKRNSGTPLNIYTLESMLLIK